jgi:TolB-like protein
VIGECFLTCQVVFEKSDRYLLRIVVTAMLKRVFFFVCMFIFFNQPTAAQEQGLRRRVLILPLDNLSRSPDHEWLRTALAENLKTQLIKTKRFDIMDSRGAKSIYPDLKIDNLSTSEAIIAAKRLNCEVVAQGRFMVIGEKFRLEMDATDVIAEKPIGAAKADGKLDSTLFSTIDSVVENLARELTIVPPLPSSIAQQRDKNIEAKITGESQIIIQAAPEKQPSPISTPPISQSTRQYNLNGYVGLGLPVSEIRNHISANYGLRASVWRNFRYRWLNPLLVSDFFYAAGRT